MKDSFRFSREFRIRKSSEFKVLYQSGLRKSGRFYAAFFLPSQGVSRLGVVVSKKIGNAVQRNREKRIIREIFRKEKVKFRQNLDLVIVVIRSASDFKRRLKELQGIFKCLSEFSPSSD